MLNPPHGRSALLTAPSAPGLLLNRALTELMFELDYPADQARAALRRDWAQVGAG